MSLDLFWNIWLGLFMWCFSKHIVLIMNIKKRKGRKTEMDPFSRCSATQLALLQRNQPGKAKHIVGCIDGDNGKEVPIGAEAIVQWSFSSFCRKAALGLNPWQLQLEKGLWVACQGQPLPVSAESSGLSGLSWNTITSLHEVLFWRVVLGKREGASASFPCSLQSSLLIAVAPLKPLEQGRGRRWLPPEPTAANPAKKYYWRALLERECRARQFSGSGHRSLWDGAQPQQLVSTLTSTGYSVPKLPPLAVHVYTPTFFYFTLPKIYIKA